MIKLPNAAQAAPDGLGGPKEFHPKNASTAARTPQARNTRNFCRSPKALQTARDCVWASLTTSRFSQHGFTPRPGRVHDKLP